MCLLLEDCTWLYRGVPEESPEVQDVEANGEIYPRNPSNKGPEARYFHSYNEMTDSAYTSWTTDPSIAIELANFASREAKLSGKIALFKVRIASIDEKRIFEGEAREDEFLIEGTVENVEFSDNGEDDE